MSGFFITFEGTDGSGKSTQVKLLEQCLIEKKFDLVSVREPGGCPISEKIREIIIDRNNSEMDVMTETLLYAAARAQLVKEVIIPALKDGKIVICDRFLDSNLAYQGYARNVGIPIVNRINSYAIENLKPDITFFLKLSPKDSVLRKKEQKELDRIEKESFNFHKRVFDGYLNISKRNKKRIQIIDASQDIETIHNEIINILSNLIGERSI